MAERVVDLLKTVEVHVQQPGRVAVVAGAHQHQFEMLLEHRPVGQPRELVVIGHEGDLLLAQLALGDVAHEHVHRPLAAHQHLPQGQLRRELAGVAVAADQLQRRSLAQLAQRPQRAGQQLLALVGRDQLEQRPADRHVTVVTEHPLGGAVPLHDLALLVGGQVGVAGRLDDRAGPLLALAQPQLGALQAADVRVADLDSDLDAVLVQDRAARAPAPLLGPVAVDDAKLGARVVVAVEQAAPQPAHAGLVLGVHVVDEVALEQLGDREPRQLLERRRHVLKPPVHPVHEDHVGHVVGDGAQQALGLDHRAFRLQPRGDVDGGAEVALDLAEVVTKRNRRLVHPLLPAVRPQEPELRRVLLAGGRRPQPILSGPLTILRVHRERPSGTGRLRHVKAGDL